MPKDCPQCVRALEELVQEIRTMVNKDGLTANLAIKMEVELQAAMAESKQALPDSKSILAKLEGAQTVIEGVAPARDLLNHFAETKTVIKRYLP